MLANCGRRISGESNVGQSGAVTKSAGTDGYDVARDCRADQSVAGVKRTGFDVGDAGGDGVVPCLSAWVMDERRLRL